MYFGAGAGIIIVERALYILNFGGRIMEIMLEKCLRDLLTKRRKTQSELAEYLSISTQAVSKWCRGENMPDIALLPRIASYLDVSVDELLGVGEIRRQEKIHEYRKKSYELSRKGLVTENIELWRKAYAELPNDMDVNEGLMCALHGANDEKYSDEALALGERILHRSTDERQRSTAIQILCLIYNKRGNKDKAKEYADMTPHIFGSRDALLLHILDGEESTEHSLQLMLDCLDIIGSAEAELCKKDGYERCLQLHEFYLKLLELYFDDGFYGIYAFYAMQRHQNLARMYLSCRKDEQKAAEHLKAAVKCARQFEALTDEYVYTSVLLNGYKCHRTLITSYTETESEQLLNFINNSEFDIVRSKEWFKEAEQELRSVVKISTQ